MSWPERRHTLPDGREVRATYEGEPVGYVAFVAGADDRPVAGRDLHDVLHDLLKPGRGLWPDWFIDAVNDLAARDTPLGRRYPCPCCGYLTLVEPPTGTYDICEVCFWEDDPAQFHRPNYRGGANKPSLNEARETFRQHGVSKVGFEKDVRPPMPEELP